MLKDLSDFHGYYDGPIDSETVLEKWLWLYRTDIDFRNFTETSKSPMDTTKVVKKKRVKLLRIMLDHLLK